MSSPTDTIQEPMGFDPLRVRRARRRMGFARYVALAAIFGGLGFAGTYAWQLGLFDTLTVNREARTPEPVASPDLVTGRNATISGTGTNNQPFEVSAKTGIQDRDKDTLVHLQTVEGMFQRPGGTQLKVDALRASYDSENKMLQLDGDVVFDEANRFIAKMQGAEVNTETQTLVSKSPVTVQMIGGTIQADSFTVNEQGQRVLFKGGVKARFVTESAATGDNP